MAVVLVVAAVAAVAVVAVVVVVVVVLVVTVSCASSLRISVVFLSSFSISPVFIVYSFICKSGDYTFLVLVLLASPSPDLVMRETVSEALSRSTMTTSRIAIKRNTRSCFFL